MANVSSMNHWMNCRTTLLLHSIVRLSTTLNLSVTFGMERLNLGASTTPCLNVQTAMHAGIQDCSQCLSLVASVVIQQLRCTIYLHSLVTFNTYPTSLWVSAICILLPTPISLTTGETCHLKDWGGKRMEYWKVRCRGGRYMNERRSLGKGGGKAKFLKREEKLGGEGDGAKVFIIYYFFWVL